MLNIIKNNINQSIELNKLILNNLDFLNQIQKVVELLINTFKTNNKLLVAGNGGSAADASHMAAELVGRFCKERKALPVICLNTDTSIITAVANDYSYDQIFLRQVKALINKNDVFLAISTSGNSTNLVKVLEYLKTLNIESIVLSGRDGGKLKTLSNNNIIVPSNNTARIQEVHSLVIHTICELVEDYFYNN